MSFVPKFVRPVEALSRAASDNLAVRTVKYGYSNARTKAMYSTLLAKKDIDALAEAKNLSEIVALLSRTYYSQDLLEEAVEFSKADLVEISLARNFSRTLKKLVKISPKTDSHKIMEIFERYDVLNIKNLLLGLHLKEPKTKIRMLLLESPKFSHAALTRLSEITNVKELVENLKGTEYFRVLDKELLEYEKTHNIQDMVQKLENFYYKKFSQNKKTGFEIAKSIKKLLQVEIDAKNIMLVLRAKKENIEEKKTISMLLEGGMIGKETLKRMTQATTIEEAAEMQNRFELQKALEEFTKNGSLARIENALEENIAKEGLKELRRSVLSLSAIVGFLFLKEKEIKNIRKIVRTKEFGFSPQEIKNLLVVA